MQELSFRARASRWYARRAPRKCFCGLLLLAFPGAACASDFSVLMVLLLIPFGIAATVVWALTWWATSQMKHSPIKTFVRASGACLVLTPTFTAGGNGRMPSVALYDIVLSLFGGDPHYAGQALINAGIATVLVVLAATVRARLADKLQQRG